VTDLVFNVAKGAVAGMLRATGGTPPGLGWNVGILALKGTITADATMRDYKTVTALLAAHTEAAAAGYSRKQVTNASVNSLNSNIAADDTNDRLDLTLPNQTWTGTGAGETWARLVVYAEPTSGAADSNRVPLTCHDFIVPTGTDITASFANGVYRAT
jgi:hypothetical protein